MKLGELHPKIMGGNIQSPIRLSFDCPLHGAPYRIDIPVVLNGVNAGPDMPKWQMSSPDPPDFSWDRVTVSPSIDNSPGGHGRKQPCNWHGTITNGQVVPS